MVPYKDNNIFGFEMLEDDLNHESNVIFSEISQFPAVYKDITLMTNNDNNILKIIDEIILEPVGGAHRDQKGTIAGVRAQLEEWLVELKAVETTDLLEQRYRKFREMGMPIEL